MQSTEDSNKKYEQKKFGRWFTITLALRLYSIKRRLTTKLVILMGVVGLLLRFSATNPPLQLPPAQPWELPSEKLQALVLFKEESHALVELVLHLYSQGFSHVRMVDNDSHRPLPTEALQEFKERGLVTLTHDRGKTIQKRSNAYAFQRMRLMGGWSMAVDGDEFPRATKVGSLLNWLVLKDEEVCSVAIPFMLFGDSGRSHQPNSILQGFLKRQDYSRLEKESRSTLEYKTAARVGCTLWPAVHHIAPFPSQRLRGYSSLNAFPRSPTIKPNKYMEEEFPDAVINHYKTQSAHFYNETKVKRGSATRGYNYRNMSVFYEHQKHWNGKNDTSLARSALSRFPSLYESKVVPPLGKNDDLTNPWPIENVRLASDELSRHQGLAIIDAASSGLPDQLGLALRNAAMLDPTWDCIVRVPPGSVVSVIGSGLTKLCATREANGTWKDFVKSVTSQYGNEYDALLAMNGSVVLPAGADTPRLRKDAKKLMKESDTPFLDCTREVGCEVMFS